MHLIFYLWLFTYFSLQLFSSIFLGKIDMVQAILKGATLYPPAEIILFLYKLFSTQSLRDL